MASVLSHQPPALLGTKSVPDLLALLAQATRDEARLTDAMDEEEWLSVRRYQLSAQRDAADRVIATVRAELRERFAAFCPGMTPDEFAEHVS